MFLACLLVSPEKDVCPGSPRCLLTIKLPTPSYKTETGTHTCTVWFLSNKPLTNSRLATPGRRDGPRPAESARSSRRNLYTAPRPASRPSSKQATTSKAPNSGSERGGGYVKFSDRIHPHLFCNFYETTRLLGKMFDRVTLLLAGETALRRARVRAAAAAAAANSGPIDTTGLL